MAVNAETYYESCILQKQGAEELMEWILKDYSKIKRKMEHIIDLGCGTGQITSEILATSLTQGTVLGIDVNPRMIDFAKNNYPSPRIDYTFGDLSGEWRILDKKIKMLEGQVDLIISNHVLHWVDKSRWEKTFKNIFRLLTPEGRIYFNITMLKPIYNDLAADTRNNFEAFCKVPTIDAQADEWIDSLKKAGLVNVRSCLSDCQSTFHAREHYLELMNSYEQHYLKYIQPGNENKMQEMWPKVLALVLKAYPVNYNESSEDEASQEESYNVVNSLFQGKAQKFNGLVRAKPRPSN